jgi:hypothetical protein
MKTPLLLATLLIFASSALAQKRQPVETAPPATAPSTTNTSNQGVGNNRFRAHFGDFCCSAPSDDRTTDDSATPFASVEIVHAHGGPDWKPSGYMTFGQAVSLGQQQTALSPGHANPAMVQQMLDLYQELQKVKEQNRVDGKSDDVKWRELKPALNPADYRRPPSTFMNYADALAVGEQADQQKQEPPPTPSLGEVAQEQRDAKPADEKAEVLIKQNADGTPVIVQKKPQQ